MFRAFPRISTIFDRAAEQTMGHLHASTIRNVMWKLVSDERLFSDGLDDREKGEFVQGLHGILPLMKWDEWGDPVSEDKHLSVFLLAPRRPNVDKFFYDMISRWLMPGRRMEIGHFFSIDFSMPDFGDHAYSYSNIVIRLEGDIEVIRSQLRIIENEIRIGVTSIFHANRILEVKGLSVDEKTALIQEKIWQLIQKRPSLFDYDLFGEMQHFLVMCREEFRALHEVDQMIRMIYVFYFFRKAMHRKIERNGEGRHLHVRLVKTDLHHPLGIKRVLSVFVGIHLLRDTEVFEERHFLKALQNCLPGIRPIPDSFFVHASQGDAIHTMYAEIEKQSGQGFFQGEIRKLKKELPCALEKGVEHLVRPIFMPRNEEEVMRNIVTLTNQLRYPKDLPQVMISFDEQTEIELSFTVIILRLLYAGSVPIQELFHFSNARLNFSVERIKIVGLLRKKYPKEVAVFRVKLPDKNFVREDQTVDFYKARKEVIGELQRLLGEVRDFNGGMISKQLELFVALKEMIGEQEPSQELLVESFFHSIFPVEMKSVLRPEPLKELFLFLLERITNTTETFKQLESRVLAVFEFQEQSLKKEIGHRIASLDIPSSQLVSTCVAVSDNFYLCYLYFSDDRSKQEKFIQTLCTIEVLQTLNP